jgi:hypothetical protein
MGGIKTFLGVKTLQALIRAYIILYIYIYINYKALKILGVPWTPRHAVGPLLYKII